MKILKLTKCNLKYECLFEMQVETWYWFSYYGGKVAVSWCLRYEIEYMPLDVANLMVWIKFQCECLVITSIVSGDDPLRHWCEIVYMSLDVPKLMVWMNAISMWMLSHNLKCKWRRPLTQCLYYAFGNGKLGWWFCAEGSWMIYVPWWL
jgi:hypothetical protein